jgi:hypothetical protein
LATMRCFYEAIAAKQAGRAFSCNHFAPIMVARSANHAYHRTTRTTGLSGITIDTRRLPHYELVV